MAVTWALVSLAVATASQISASPPDLSARVTSFQVSPAPLTVTVCFPATSGPSDPTRASNSSLLEAVWKAALVTGPLPWATVLTSTVKQVDALDTVTVTGADFVTFPLTSVAWALRVWLPLRAVVVFHDTV